MDYEAECLLDSLQDVSKSVGLAFEKLELIQKAFNAIDNDVPDFEPEEGAYGYVALNLNDCLDSLLDLENILKGDPDYCHSDLAYRPCAFIEAGCGTGRNIFLMKHADRFHFHKVVGFDISDIYIEHGRRLFGLGEDIFVADCRTFDYGGFDIVQFYRPYSDEEMEAAFERHLIGSMKRAAFLVGHLAVVCDQSPLLMPLGDTGRIWKKL